MQCNGSETFKEWSEKDDKRTEKLRKMTANDLDSFEKQNIQRQQYIDRNDKHIKRVSK